MGIQRSDGVHMFMGDTAGASRASRSKHALKLNTTLHENDLELKAHIDRMRFFNFKSK